MAGCASVWVTGQAIQRLCNGRLQGTRVGQAGEYHASLSTFFELQPKSALRNPTRSNLSLPDWTTRLKCFQLSAPEQRSMQPINRTLSLGASSCITDRFKVLEKNHFYNHWQANGGQGHDNISMCNIGHGYMPQGIWMMTRLAGAKGLQTQESGESSWRNGSSSIVGRRKL